jgi:hypothetical protein
MYRSEGVRVARTARRAEGGAPISGGASSHFRIFSLCRLRSERRYGVGRCVVWELENACSAAARFLHRDTLDDRSSRFPWPRRDISYLIPPMQRDQLVPLTNLDSPRCCTCRCSTSRGNNTTMALSARCIWDKQEIHYARHLSARCRCSSSSRVGTGP